MTREKLEQQYWHYYLHLEKQFMETIDYVELNVNNYKAFSDAYALLMQAIGAELDTVFKVYCGYNLSDRKTIADYEKAITLEDGQPNPFDYSIRDQEIWVSDYGIRLQPFKDWDANKPAESLDWWKAFTNLKHDRYSNRDKGNQGNAIDILAALFLLEMRMVKRITDGTDEYDVFDNGSKLFTLKKWSSKAIPVGCAFGALGEILASDGGKPTTKYDV